MSQSAVGHEHGPSGMLGGKGRPLRNEEIESLWEICCEINNKWRLFCSADNTPTVHALNRMHSSWLEFIRLRADPQHDYQGLSYIAEYENAIEVASKLKRADPENAFSLLFSVDAQVPSNPTIDGSPPPVDPMLHAKKFVVDEFMTVMIVAGGFRQFGGENYNGFVAGSRFSRTVDISSEFSYPQRGGQHEEG
ncbi:MAG: hypothetical protein V7746_21025 [Halioglobus sp.]